MLYMICFLAALLLLLVLVYYEKTADSNLTILIITIAVGSGGYYALSQAKDVSEAILANKVIYVTACFSPLFVLLIISSICRVTIPRLLRGAAYILQLVIYLSVCTIGRSTLFYKTIELHQSATGAYITRTYGPMHTLHLVMMLLYTIAGFVIGLYSLHRKSVVSRVNVFTLLFSDLIVIGIYLMQRMVHLHYDLMSLSFTLGAAIYLILILKLNRFSMLNNQNILEDRFRETAYIFFSKNLKYMGCSDHAGRLFPELLQWELEEKIPGNGGRFNTFLRQPLLAFTRREDQEKPDSSTFTYKDRVYRYEIAILRTGNGKKGGYTIQMTDVTDILTERPRPENNEDREE